MTAAVNNFRFNESPLDLLRRATEAGVSEVTLPREWGDWVDARGDAVAADSRLPHVIGEPGAIIHCVADDASTTELHAGLVALSPGDGRARRADPADVRAERCRCRRCRRRST